MSKNSQTNSENQPSNASHSQDKHAISPSRLALKAKTRMFYDVQLLRMQISGRSDKKLDGGKKARATTIELRSEDKATLNGRLDSLSNLEKTCLEDVEKHLYTIPFYNQHIKDKYRGLGVASAAVILSEFDIARETTPSKMWRFAGLAPMPCKRCSVCWTVVEEDGEHPKARAVKAKDDEGNFVTKQAKIKCPHAGSVAPTSVLVDSGRAERPTSGEALHYNAFLRTKLIGVLGTCLLKAGGKINEETGEDTRTEWRRLYDNYKNRKASAGWGQSDGHRHNAALRYMVKMVLLDIWLKWRAFEGLPIRESYQEQYLGHRHAA
jgi:hypothetical protein